MKNSNLLIVCATILLSTLIFKSTGIYIKSLAGSVESGGRVSDTISVSGDGQVTAKPDMVSLSLGFSETAPNSKGALDKVNQKITQSVNLLKKSGIQDKDITTNSLNLYPEYEYQNSSRRLIGQRASQTLTAKIRQIDDKATKASSLIDELSTIDNIQINAISFDIEDKTKLFEQARELAYNKAKDKASQLAKLANVKLQKPVSISDTTYDISPVPQYSNLSFKSLSADSASNTQLPSGELTVKANLQILWGIQ